MNQDMKLFQMALGLESPWQVVGYEFSPADRKLTLGIDFESGGTFSCPICEQSGCKAYDTSEKSWRHLNFFQHEAFIQARLARSKVLFATEGKDAGTVSAFRQDLEKHGGVAEQIEEICMDMSPAFIQGAQRTFPLASLTFDKFHVMKILGTAVDEVRRAEQKERPELVGSRYVWLKNAGKWTRRQRELFERLTPARLNLKTVRAYRIKLAFQEFWTLPAELAEPFLKRWYRWATHSRLPPIVEAARSIKRHWSGILRWFTSRISNGVLEGINSLVQAARARARGYRSTRNFVTMVYLIAGKLQLHSPT